MRTELYYFTGTGNGLHIAKSIQSKLELLNQEVALIPINSMDLTSRISSSAERVGIIYPTYAMSAPSIVKEFAKQMRVSSGSYLFLYAHSGGGGAKGSLYAINRILTDNGVKISGTFETTFPSNSTMMAYTDEKLDKVLNEAEVSIKNHVEVIVNKGQNEVAKTTMIKNTSATLTEKLAGAFENMLQFKIISADDSCVGCNTCEKVCPVENIEMKSGRPTFKKNCEMCMACINQCPKQSLAFGKMKKEKLLSYRHPQVELKELMYR